MVRRRSGSRWKHRDTDYDAFKQALADRLLGVLTAAALQRGAMLAKAALRQVRPAASSGKPT